MITLNSATPTTISADNLFAILANPKSASDLLAQISDEMVQYQQVIDQWKAQGQDLENQKNYIAEAQAQVDASQDTLNKQSVTFNQYVESKNKDLATRESAVALREQTADTMQQQNNAMQADLKNREQAVAQRESSISTRESIADQKTSDAQSLIDTYNQKAEQIKGFLS